MQGGAPMNLARSIMRERLIRFGSAADGLPTAVRR
jgi:hypothetical protein